MLKLSQYCLKWPTVIKLNDHFLFTDTETVINFIINNRNKVVTFMKTPLQILLDVEIFYFNFFSIYVLNYFNTILTVLKAYK